MKNSSLYFCSECKKILKSLEDLLFIEEHSHKGFCSGDCIEDFYSPLIHHFEVLEHSLRVKYGLLEESSNQLISESNIEDVLNDPDEVYKCSNELFEAYYSFIKNFSDYSLVIVASVYNFEASFIFLNMKTSSVKLLNEFRFEENVTELFLQSKTQARTLEDESSESGDHASDDGDDDEMVFMQHLESKKSKILGDILMLRQDDDIQFEEYNNYDFCFQDTLDFPDEVFEFKDNEGDVLFFYLKTFSNGAKITDNFTYIVIAIKHKSDSLNVNIYPILAIPTLDLKLCQEFRKGTRLSGALKN